MSNHFVTSLFSERRIRTALNILRARWDYFLCFAAHSFLLDWRARGNAERLRGDVLRDGGACTDSAAADLQQGDESGVAADKGALA